MKAKTPYRVVYQFMPYHINEFRYRWEVTWCVDLKKWIYYRYKQRRTEHSKIDTPENASVATIFKTNQLREVQVLAADKANLDYANPIFHKKFGR